MTRDASPTPPAALPWDPELPSGDGARRRFEWARSRGHPQYLWPDVEPAALRRALRELERVARAALAGGHARVGADETDRPGRVDGPGRDEGAAPREPAATGGLARARALSVAGFTSGLGPMVGRWIEDGALEAATPLIGDVFAAHLAHGRIRAERLAAMAADVLGGMAGAGLDPIVVKSGHAAVAFFPEPGARPSVDLDLVVPPADFRAAETVLERLGFLRAAGQRRPRKSDWLAPGAARWPRSVELLHADSQYAVDLHDSLERNFHGVRSVRPGPVEEVPTERADVVGGRARVLGQPGLLAYHALHASEGLEHLTLVRLVELVRMARAGREDGTLVGGEVVGLLDRVGGTAFAWPALLLAERLSPGTFDADLLDATSGAAPRAMRRVLADLAPGDAQRFDVLTLRERFMWCATPADYARRAAHMLFPAPAGSARGLGRMYVDRAYRLLRGNVSLRRPSE